ncbi:unnamed protein product [Polarella glacialis]|uniref:Uncharacterized protein n=1 Tax=Polarella glacialis TaxID=89957 RepID=A0A813FLU2_POLGL|nr:unnamed protein product [Polarella glacialis]
MNVQSERLEIPGYGLAATMQSLFSHPVMFNSASRSSRLYGHSRCVHSGHAVLAKSACVLGFLLVCSTVWHRWDVANNKCHLCLNLAANRKTLLCKSSFGAACGGSSCGLSCCRGGRRATRPSIRDASSSRAGRILLAADASNRIGAAVDLDDNNNNNHNNDDNNHHNNNNTNTVIAAAAIAAVAVGRVAAAAPAAAEVQGLGEAVQAPRVGEEWKMLVLPDVLAICAAIGFQFWKSQNKDGSAR